MSLPEDSKKPMNDITVSKSADQHNFTSRRDLLTRIPGAAGVTFASTALSFASTAQADQSASSPASTRRVVDSFQVRLEAAKAEARVPTPKQTPNQDERLYTNFIGNYGKGLPHNSIGEVNITSYRTLLSAINAGSFQAFEQVPLGGNVKQGNPLSGLAFDIEGIDSHQLAIPAAPAVASQVRADEAVELYWMALLRRLRHQSHGAGRRCGIVVTSGL